MIKAVIFDLDGVLVSTDELHYQAWQRLAGEIGITTFTREDNERQRGVSRMSSLEVVLEKSDVVYTEEEKLALAERKNNYYVEMLGQLDESAALAGAFDTLRMLRARGIKCAIGSASKNTPAILELTGLAQYIDAVSCGLDVTRSKPAPDVFLVAASKLGLKPEVCLVAEDSAAGIVAAKAANMSSLALGPLCETLGGDYAARDLCAVADWDSVLS